MLHDLEINLSLEESLNDIATLLAIKIKCKNEEISQIMGTE